MLKLVLQGRAPLRSRLMQCIAASAAVVLLSLLGVERLALAGVVVGWDVHGSTGFGASPMAASACDAHVTCEGLTRGSGVTLSGTAAARAWGGTGWATSASAADAVTAGQLAYFSVTPTSGYKVSFSSIQTFDYRRSDKGPTSGTLQYQVGTGGFVDLGTVSYSSTSSSGASLGPISLSGVAALQNVPAGTKVTFRIVNYAAGGSGGTWYLFDKTNSTGNDLELQGSVDPMPLATQVSPETAPDGSGTLIPSQALAPGAAVTAYAVTRDANGGFVANAPAIWSLAALTGGVAASDLVASADGRSAIFTAHQYGSAVLSPSVNLLTSVPSGVLTVGLPAVSVAPETAPDGSGTLIPEQTLYTSNTVTAYAVARDANHAFVANLSASWSLTVVSGGVSASDLVPSADGTSAVFTANAEGVAALRTMSGSLAPGESGQITVVTPPRPLQVSVAVVPARVLQGGTLTVTATVTPGVGPASTGVSVVGDLSALGGASATPLRYDSTDATGALVFSASLVVPRDADGGDKTLLVAASDEQGRGVSATGSVRVLGSVAIFHVNDTHARVTPHKWRIPSQSLLSTPFEDVGGAAYLASVVLHLSASKPESLFIDGGDISEGNPVGDMHGNGAMTEFYRILSDKLKRVDGRGGRGVDAVVVGNHDVRNADYIANLMDLANAGVPVVSMNVLNKTTHTPYFAPYTVVTLNGTRVGILGYTTQAAEVGASLSETLEVVDCDWNGTSSSVIHIANYVKELRNDKGCDIVVLAAHVGHTAIATDTSRDGEAVKALLVDDGAVKLPEVAVTGHWHTYTDTVWQPEELNYKTIFTESSSYMKYVGEVEVDGSGKYLSAAQHVVRDADYAPDQDVAAFVADQTALYDEQHPGSETGKVLGYTADDLMLDNAMRWWSADEYPWSGNNTAGQWICDGMRWKAAELFGQCDLAIEAGGGVRADIPAGPVTVLQVYETFPWSDDTFYRVNMTGQNILDFLKATNCDAGFSSALHVKAYDGVPTEVTFDGAPIDRGQVYTVAINNYMYDHPPTGWTWSDTNPLTSTALCRDGLIEYMQQFDEAHPYKVGGDRYDLNTEFSGGYRAVVTVMNDHDTKPVYDDAFIRLLTATPVTLGRRGSRQVPTELVREDGTVDPGNRLVEQELYRSYLAFKPGMLKPGDIIETWGKGSFYKGNPEFVDQEGIVADGVELKVVGHDASLAKPAYRRSISEFWNDANKNHYVSFLAKKTSSTTVADQNGTSVALKDVTGYANATIPGSVGDVLLVSGIPTMENYQLLFRTSQAVTGSYVLPTAGTVSSTLAATPALTTSGGVVLTATASAKYSVSPSADVQVSSLNATKNYSSATWVYVQSSTSGFGDERGWFKFDLSGIPVGSTILEATFRSYCWKAAGAALPAELWSSGDNSWTESAITWATQPALETRLGTQTFAAGAENVWYSWDVTSAVQARWSGDKVASFVVKAASEGASDSTAPSYAFDGKEYGSNAPALEVVLGSAEGASSVKNVQFYYRYSKDNATWGDWTLADTVTTAVSQGSGTSTYASTFNFPAGDGYYEFYAAATDASGGTESTPPAAQASIHRTTPVYTTEAIVQLGDLARVFDGTPKAAAVTTIPPSLATSISYDGSADVPVHAGSYAVTASVSQPGFTGSGSATLNITRAAQAITLAQVDPVEVGTAPFNLQATATSGLPVTLTSSDTAVATVSGTKVTVLAAGTATLTATQSGNADYLAAPAVQTSLIVTQAYVSAPALPMGSLPALAGLLSLAGAVGIGRRRRED